MVPFVSYPNVRMGCDTYMRRGQPRGMEIHIAVADLPKSVQALAEKRPSDLYIVVAARLSQASTAAAVADVVMTAMSESPT